MRSTRRCTLILVAMAAAVLLAACGSSADPSTHDAASAAGEHPGPAGAVDEPAQDPALLASGELRPRIPATRPAPSAAITPTPSATPEATPEQSAAEAPASEVAPTSARDVAEVAWTPFATIGAIVLHHPSSRVERIGFHEATHDGARQMDVAGSAVRPMTLESRGRGTGSRSAADIVVDPVVEIRSPVTGTVLRAGTYVLYCDYSDGYVVVEPDGWPGWEAKILHIDRVRVASGDRVVAGETVIASRPTPLPFESQVDEFTAEPSWPHVHVEVVDTSIPRKPSPGGGC